MKKDTKCIICKHKDLPVSSKYSHEMIFDDKGNSVDITLCHGHSVDLFKSGQKNFLLKHHDILHSIISSEDSKFIRVLTQTARTYFHLLY